MIARIKLFYWLGVLPARYSLNNFQAEILYEVSSRRHFLIRRTLSGELVIEG